MFSATTAPFDVHDPVGLSVERDSLYGSAVVDDAGNCYVVGRHYVGRGRGYRPIVLKVTPRKMGK